MKPTKELIENSKHFCILPWIHFHAWPDKRVMPCCVADSNLPVSRINDEESILDLMNSDEYKYMRLAMLNDEPYEACNRCYSLEKSGTWTLRQSQNMVRGMDNIDLIEATNIDGSIDEFKMKYMDIRFSNLCNFKCRSCGPACSNLWGEEKLKIIAKDTWLHDHGREPLLTNNNDGMFMDKLRPYLNDVEECYFAGGEILIHPEHYECLDHWIDNGMCENIRLNYTTNMSKITYIDKDKKRDLFDLWSHFPNIEVWASIDAIGEAGEIIRKGFKWDKVKRNLFSVKEQAPHVKLKITPTVSIWNIFDYLEMFKWMYANGIITPEHSPRVNLATMPYYSDISILPDHMRSRLAKEFKDYADQFTVSNGCQEIRNGFWVIIHALENGKESRDGLIDFFIENEIMDECRDEFFEDVNEQMRELRQWTEN